MSYILDALKKSEKEQKSNKLNILSGEETLLSDSVDNSSSLKRSILLLTLSFIFLAILVVLAWFLFTVKSNQQVNTNSQQSLFSSANNQGDIDNNAKPSKTENVQTSPNQLAGKVKSNQSQLTNSQEQTNQPEAIKPTANDVDFIETGIPDAINQLQINVLSYAPTANRRFVMISNKSYKQGASIDISGYSSKIVEIRQDGIVLEYQGEFYLKRP